MGIVTVRELIASLPDTPVFAGHAGLDNTINTVSFIDAPSSLERLNGGEVILTTAFLFRENDEMQLEFVQKLVEMGVVALGVKIGRFIDELPQAAIAYANKKDFPIFGIGYDTVWSEIFSAFYTLSFDRKDEYGILNTEIIAFDKLLRSPAWGQEAIQLNFLKCLKLPAIIVDKRYNILSCNGGDFIGELEGYCERRRKYCSRSEPPDSFVTHARNRHRIHDSKLYFDERLILYDTNGGDIRWNEMSWVPSLYGSIRKKNKFIQDTPALWKNFILEYIVGGLDDNINNYLQALRLNENILGTIIVFSGKTVSQAVDEFKRLLRFATNRKEVLIHDDEIDGDIVMLYIKQNSANGRHFFIELREITQKIVKKYVNCHIWVGEPVAKIDGLRQVFLQVMSARELSSVLLPDEEIVFYRDLSVFDWLRENGFDYSEITYLNEQISSFDACKTLEIYLESGNTKRAAERSFIHDNTMRYRVNKLEQCLNMDLNKPLNRLNLLLKIKLWRISENQ